MANETNPFDQFDEVEEVNPFDQFDVKDTSVKLPDADNPFQVVDQMVNDNLFGEAIDLPVPNSGMYSDVEGDAFSFSDRAEVDKKITARYEMYAQHPDASYDLAGNLTYKNEIVPTQTVGIFTGDGGVPVTSKIGYGLKRAGKNLLELGGAGMEKLRSAIHQNIGALQIVDTEGNFDLGWLNPQEIDEYYTKNPEAGVWRLCL